MIKYLDNDGYTISEMILMLRDPFGVYVQFNEPKTSQFVMCRDLHNPQLEEEVTIKLGGNPWTLPRSYFIDRQIAAQVASSYIDSKSGERPSGFGWIES
jgi:Immunity protein Imm1